MFRATREHVQDAKAQYIDTHVEAEGNIEEVSKALRVLLLAANSVVSP